MKLFYKKTMQPIPLYAYIIYLPTILIYIHTYRESCCCTWFFELIYLSRFLRNFCVGIELCSILILFKIAVEIVIGIITIDYTEARVVLKNF